MLDPQSKRKKHLTQKVRNGLCVGSVLIVLFLGCKKTPPLENYGPVPDFKFETHRNQSFTRNSMLGHTSVANFIFTRCRTICPVESMKMQRLLKKTVKTPSIAHYSFSVDPTHDTPSVLADFAKQYGNDSRWHFITGDSKLMRQTVEGALKISMEKRGEVDGIPDIVHGNHFVLIDAEAHIRGYYDSTDPSRMSQLADDAMALERVR